MSLSSKIITKEDYSKLNGWYRAWGFPEVANEGVMPEYGLIIYDTLTQEEIVAGFLYITDSVIACPEWIVANRFSKGKERRQASFAKLLSEFEKYATEKGYTIFIVSIQSESLIKTLQNNGFKKADTNMTNLIKTL